MLYIPFSVTVLSHKWYFIEKETYNNYFCKVLYNKLFQVCSTNFKHGPLMLKEKKNHHSKTEMFEDNHTRYHQTKNLSHKSTEQHAEVANEMVWLSYTANVRQYTTETILAKYSRKLVEMWSQMLVLLENIRETFSISYSHIWNIPSRPIKV